MGIAMISEHTSPLAALGGPSAERLVADPYARRLLHVLRRGAATGAFTMPTSSWPRWPSAASARGSPPGSARTSHTPAKRCGELDRAPVRVLL